MKHYIFFIICFFWNIIAAGEKESPKLRFFNLDLHISVIADVKNIFERLGHEIVDWSISDHTWVFDKPKAQVEIINQNTWANLNQKMCDQFYERYKDFLDQFDGFIVTHTPAFALLYERCNKPIIIVNSTRYESPFTRNPELWKLLNEYLKKGVKNNKIFIVSNNKGDCNYLRYYTGIESEVIPSLCLYTNLKYRGGNDTFYCHALWDTSFRQSWNKIASYIGLFTELSPRYAWEELYNLKGVVHFPYQVSTMSLFEQYSANIPLFLPTKEFLVKLHKLYPQNILCQLSFLGQGDMPSKPRDDLNNTLNPDILKLWIDSADYYDPENMPHIQYFHSFQDLNRLLKTVNCAEISRKMEQYNKIRQENAFKKWRELLEKVYEARKNCKATTL